MIHLLPQTPQLQLIHNQHITRARQFDNEETLFHDDTEEYVVFSKAFLLPLEKLMNNDISEAKAAINALLVDDLYVPCSFPFLADQIVSCSRKMWNDRDQGVLPTTANKPFDGEDRTVEIGFVAASKSSIEGLKRVRIDDQVVVSCSTQLVFDRWEDSWEC
ncbi:hypothetical protein PanWU01x14_174260 [Parasponia andersonii]|uniref:Uncharacterized protein n=1 Tax=Parasponia andersonii TaxID=3476 RepID=A0A2P5C8E1_PARAD|nr:hypothetical protein PanWU01x14_174260 [Parasponia andersonii]